jgi:hypothetical protein
MNIVITFMPLVSQFYSPLFLIPSVMLSGGTYFRSILYLSSTASIYFIKPDYMDFYPVAIAAGVIAVLFLFKSFNSVDDSYGFRRSSYVSK